MPRLFRDTSHRTTTTTTATTTVTISLFPIHHRPHTIPLFSRPLLHLLRNLRRRLPHFLRKNLSPPHPTPPLHPPTPTEAITPVKCRSRSLSLTSTAASRVKKLKALGLRSLNTASLGLKNSSFLNGGGGGSGGDGGGVSGEVSLKTSKPVTVGELMRVQMRVPESVDSRIRKAFLRIAASQLGKRIDNLGLPLELLQQLKSSDITDQQEYDEWQKRNLRVLEAGLILHPYQPFKKADASAQRLQKIIRGALERPIEAGKNDESMQVLRSAVVTLACRGADGLSDSCR